MNKDLFCNKTNGNNNLPLDFPVYCNGCGWRGLHKDTKEGWDQEGWEYPMYRISMCPICKEGVEI